jgi:NADH-quinone oxidoreductase subunit N
VESRFIWLAIIGVITTVISFYYYLYIIVQMYMREPNDDFSDLRLCGSLKIALAISAIGTLYLGVLPTRVLDWTATAALNTLR